MPKLFIISGCNGAGKTTASFTILPDLLQINEFVNADEIARGLSPFQPEKVSIEAGKIMLKRIQDLLSQKKDFAFKTTLSSRSIVGLIKNAKQQGYTVTLIYYWLDNVELAVERVQIRVAEGGHAIPTDTIVRRYYAGINNFIKIYNHLADHWFLIDNSQSDQDLIGEGKNAESLKIYKPGKWDTFNLTK